MEDDEYLVTDLVGLTVIDKVTGDVLGTCSGVVMGDDMCGTKGLRFHDPSLPLHQSLLSPLSTVSITIRFSLGPTCSYFEPVRVIWQLGTEPCAESLIIMRNLF